MILFVVLMRKTLFAFDSDHSIQLLTNTWLQCGGDFSPYQYPNELVMLLLLL